VRKARKDASLFQLIDRKIFDQLVNKHDVDQGVRSFTTWEMTAVLIEALTLRLDSFRAIEETLKIPRSTLSDAMRLRLSAFFQDLCDAVLNGIRKRTTDRKVRRAIKELLAIDSSEVDVHGSLFDRPSWAKKIGEGHRASLKFHVVWNVDRGWVEDFSITGNRKHDSPVAAKFQILSGKTYVFDRAYNDLGFWLKITAAGSDFVTRLKDNASLRKFRLAVIKVTGLIDKTHDGILYDGEYKPTASVINRNKNEIEGQRFRHIIYRDPETKKIFDFVTSNFEAQAQEIADIYKRRWAVELLFRWLKGHLNLRRLPVKNVNASEILMAAAVLVMLLLQLKKILEKFGGTLWQLLRSIRSALNREALSRRAFHDNCRWLSAPEADFPS
jgi:hypothetical protein